MSTGHVYPVAGGGPPDGTLAMRTGLIAPTAVTVDRHGNLLVSSAGDKGPADWAEVQSERTGTFYGRRMTVGHIYTVAGGGNGTDEGPGTPATAAGRPRPPSPTRTASSRAATWSSSTAGTTECGPCPADCPSGRP
jgi:hypothetical protein